MSPEPGPPAARRSKAEVKRERLLYAAMVCISRLGFKKSTMEEIAAEAGVTRVTIYREFGNREALIDAIIAHRLTAFNDNFLLHTGPHKDMASVLEAYILAAVRAARENLITRELVRGPLDFTTPGSPIHAISIGMWRPWFEAAQLAGRISEDTKLEETAEWILIVQHTLSRLFVDSETSERRLRKIIRSFILPAFRGPAAAGERTRKAKPPSAAGQP